MMRDRIQENFLAFHAENPRVYELFDRFACEMLRAGRRNGSAKLIFERIRWEVRVVTRSAFDVKLNNNYHSRYARLWEERNPQHAGFFRTRQLAAETLDSVNVPEVA